MTDLLVFDTDCLSAFLWVQREDLLEKLYSRQMIIPRQVCDELSNPAIPHLKTRLDKMLNSGSAAPGTFAVGTEAFALYEKMTHAPDSGCKVIGKGEAAALVLAKENGGIVASNNLKDISAWLTALKLKNMTTGDILIDALKQNHIDEDEGNVLWAAMLAKRRKLGAASFSDYIKLKLP